MDGVNLNLSDVLHDHWVLEDDFPIAANEINHVHEDLYRNDNQGSSRPPYQNDVMPDQLDRNKNLVNRDSEKRVFVTPAYQVPEEIKPTSQMSDLSSLFTQKNPISFGKDQSSFKPTPKFKIDRTKQPSSPKKQSRQQRPILPKHQPVEPTLYMAQMPDTKHPKPHSGPRGSIKSSMDILAKANSRRGFVTVKEETPNIPTLHQQAQMEIAYMNQLNQNFEQMIGQPSQSNIFRKSMDPIPRFFNAPPDSSSSIPVFESRELKRGSMSNNSDIEGMLSNNKYSSRQNLHPLSLQADYELPKNFLEGPELDSREILLDVDETATVNRGKSLVNTGYADIARGLEGHHDEKLQLGQGIEETNEKTKEKHAGTTPNAGGDEIREREDADEIRIERVDADDEMKVAEEGENGDGMKRGNAVGGDCGDRADNESDRRGRRGVVNNEASSSSGCGDSCGATTTGTTKTSSAKKSSLQELLQQPIRSAAQGNFPYFPSVPYFIAPNGVKVVVDPAMQFYQAHAAPHHMRNTPPPGSFVQPYAMNVRPHEEETRQIMNLDNQQTTNSSPTSSWNAHQQYAQMTNMNAYQQRGPPIYPPPPMPHNGASQVVPTSNPYYPAHHHPHPHPHMPQAPMMPPGMHGQQPPPQQPYFSAQSPLNAMIPVGTPPMPFGSAAPMPPMTNGNGSLFNFSKPRGTAETSAASSSSTTSHRKKKQQDLSSPRYSDDIEGSVFPDMIDFPLLDVIQSKAKKDAGRKPCRPHLCEQSRMLISRVCHFHREFAKRLNPRHPLTNSPMSKPDQWTSQLMGISLATVRKCMDMACEEEVFTRCTDKNLVNLTPAERAERDEMLSKLSTVFEDEKTLGAGTAGLTIAEYSPRRQYSNTNVHAISPDDDKSKYSMNDGDSGHDEPTLLNLDDHSNSSKGVSTPSSSMAYGGDEMGSLMMGGMMQNLDGDNRVNLDKDDNSKGDTPRIRGRPKKTNVTANKTIKVKEANDEIVEDKDEIEKKTEDENETTPESELAKKENEENELEREDDAASSEGTNRSETATPEPNTTSVGKGRRGRKKRVPNAEKDESGVAAKKKKSQTGENGSVDDENGEHKMLTRTRSRQP